MLSWQTTASCLCCMSFQTSFVLNIDAGSLRNHLFGISPLKKSNCRDIAGVRLCLVLLTRGAAERFPITLQPDSVLIIIDQN